MGDHKESTASYLLVLWEITVIFQ